MGCVSGTTQKQRLPNAGNQTGQLSHVKTQNQAQPVQAINNSQNKKQEINQQNAQPKDHLQPQKNQLVAPVQNHPNVPSELPHEVINPTINYQKNEDLHVDSLEKKFQNVQLQKIPENEVHGEQKVEIQLKQLKDTSDEDIVHSEGETNFRPPIRNNVNFNIQIS